MSFFPTPQRPSYLVEFKAGKCVRENNMLKPDLRKGTIYMDRSDDQLMHFYWKERNSSQPEDDLIIFPDEAEMIKVDECTTGRVYLLKFKTSSQKFFYWMQNKTDEKDQDVVSRVNRLIDDPQSVINESRSANRMDFGNDNDLAQILDGNPDIGMSQENLMQFLQAAGGFGGTVPTPSRLGGDGPIDSGMDVDETTVSHHEDGSGGDARLSDAQILQIKDTLDELMVDDEENGTYTLDSQVVHALNPLLNDRDLRSALFPDMPAVTSQRTQDELEQLTEMPQFQSALYKIDQALQQDLLASTLAYLELSSPMTVNDFIKAMEHQANIRRQRRGSSNTTEQ